MIDTVDKVGAGRRQRNISIERWQNTKMIRSIGAKYESFLRPNGQKILYQQYRSKADGARRRNNVRNEYIMRVQSTFYVSERPEFVYEHVWRTGDLLLWDNRCSAHARTDFPAGERRLMLRTTVAGTVKPF